MKREIQIFLLEPRKRRLRETGENCISLMRNFMILYSSPSVKKMIKSRAMKWAVHVANMGEMKNAQNLIWKSERESTGEI